MRLHRFFAGLVCVVSTQALAPANPLGWDDKQPDGSPTGRLYLEGRPDVHVYTVDKHRHPVVRNDDGWYVYATVDTNQTRRQWFQPTEYRVSPDSLPPRHLQDKVLQERTPPPLLDKILCRGQPRSTWCPNNDEDITRYRRSAPKTTGIQKVIVLLIQFSDHADREMPSRADFDFFFNGQGLHEELAPTGTLQDFFRLQSLGKYTLDAHVEDWFVAPETEEYYSFGRNGITADFAQCAFGALDRMDKGGFDFSEYDQDGDNFIDNVIILHSGYVAEGGGTDCINNKALGSHRIWSHATNNQDWTSSGGIFQLGEYSTTSAVFGTCGNDIARVGIVGHEYLHTLGLPDLFGGAGQGVGIYDVMGFCWGADGTLRYPATMGPWSRQSVGWVQPTRITVSGHYQIGTSQLYPDAIRIDVGFPEGEYLLIENRQKIHMDAIMPGEGGLLIWHIDESKQTDWQSAPGWPLQEGWPGNNNHYQIALLSPDGSYDIEMGNNFGDHFDSWTKGRSLEPGPGHQRAESDQLYMYPNTDSYSGGVIQSTGVRIYDISELGEIMSFRVEIPGSIPDFDSMSVPTLAPTAGMPMSIPPIFMGLPSLESVFATSGSLPLSRSALSILTALVTAATMFGL